MGQIDDNEFTIKEDGTIVRDSSSSKINQMKKKISSENNFKNQRKGKKGKTSRGWFAILFIIGLIIIGIAIFKGGNDDYSYSYSQSYALEDSSMMEANGDEKIVESHVEDAEEFVTRRYTKEIGGGHETQECKIMVDYPIGGKSELVNVIRQWINKYLASVSETTQYSYGLSDGTQLIDYYCSRAWGELCENCHLSINIRKEYETNKYITFLCSFYAYSSDDAHGMGSEGGATFRKSDGMIIDWAMFKNDNDMQRLIKDGLNEFFGDEDYDKDYTPLPAENPILLSNGVKFIYGVYELEGTSHAAGQPNFTIPYSEIESQMNSSLRELIK